MEVGPSVAPAVEVNAGDVAQGQDGAFHPRGDSAEVRRQLLGQVGERVDVHPAGQPHRARQAASNRWVQGPVLVRPDGRRCFAGTDPARLAAGLTAARWLRHHSVTGLSRHERLVTGLLQRLTDDFQQEFWPALTGSGSGRQRLSASLKALFEVADRHLDLLAVSDQVFHWAAERCEFPGGSQGFLGPFVNALLLGARDGSLVNQERAADTADVLFNTACWGYVHLRHRHGWARARARSQIHEMLIGGLTGRKSHPR